MQQEKVRGWFSSTWLYARLDELVVKREVGGWDDERIARMGRVFIPPRCGEHFLLTVDAFLLVQDTAVIVSCITDISAAVSNTHLPMKGRMKGGAGQN